MTQPTLLRALAVREDGTIPNPATIGVKAADVGAVALGTDGRISGALIRAATIPETAFVATFAAKLAGYAVKAAANTFTAAQTFSGALTASGVVTLSGDVTATKTLKVPAPTLAEHAASRGYVDLTASDLAATIYKPVTLAGPPKAVPGGSEVTWLAVPGPNVIYLIVDGSKVYTTTLRSFVVPLTAASVVGIVAMTGAAVAPLLGSSYTGSSIINGTNPVWTRTLATGVGAAVATDPDEPNVGMVTTGAGGTSADQSTFTRTGSDGLPNVILAAELEMEYEFGQASGGFYWRTRRLEGSAQGITFWISYGSSGAVVIRRRRATETADTLVGKGNFQHRANIRYSFRAWDSPIDNTVYVAGWPKGTPEPEVGTARTDCYVFSFTDPAVGESWLDPATNKTTTLTAGRVSLTDYAFLNVNRDMSFGNLALSTHTATAPPPPGGPGTPSGFSMLGDVDPAKWSLGFATGFDETMPLGADISVHPTYGVGLLPYNTPAQPYSYSNLDAKRVYTWGHDTSKWGFYIPQRCLSVKADSSILTNKSFFDPALGTAATGGMQVSAAIQLSSLPGAGRSKGQIYGRTRVVKRVIRDSPNPSPKSVDLWFPSNGTKWFDGPEHDWPEGYHGSAGSPKGFYHSAAGSNQKFPPDVNGKPVSSGIDWQEWHCYEQEWSPGVVKYLIDGKQYGPLWTNDVASAYQKFTLQPESAIHTYRTDPETGLPTPPYEGAALSYKNRTNQTTGEITQIPHCWQPTKNTGMTTEYDSVAIWTWKG